MAKKSDKVTLRETFEIHSRAAGNIRKFCTGIFGIMILNAIVSAISPYVTVYFSARIINELAGERRQDILWQLVIITLISAAVLTLIKGALGRWEDAVVEKYRMNKAHFYADKMLSMDFADVDKTETHDLRYQISQNEGWAGWGYNQFLSAFERLVESVAGILGAIVLTISLFTLSVPETAGALVILNHPIFVIGMAAIFLITTALGPICKTKAADYWAKSAESSRFGNRVFSAFGFLTEDQTRAMDFRMYNQQVICRYYMNLDKTFGVGGVMSKNSKGPAGAWAALGACISAVLTGIVYVFVCLKAWAGAFGIGSVTQYIGAATALTGNIFNLIANVGIMKNNVPFMRTVYEFFDIPNNIYQGSLTTEKRKDRQYEVEFRDVSFHYPGSTQWALRHVSMKFKIGQRMAVVGENGSGKTTFIKLLCRLYDPQEGQILLNGIDIRKYNYRDYMDVFSIVFQDFQLIAQPLGANVAGSAQYDRQRVEKALIDAGFKERLKTMPAGLDTMLYKDFEKEGVDVSGGEAQKIAIARALYKNAPFIILDEPTAALDPIAEAEIYSKFNDIVGDKTAIYISHRLSSCKFCDEIMVFDKGEVIQRGTHEELLAEKNGKYYELWNAQAKYYTEKSV